MVRNINKSSNIQFFHTKVREMVYGENPDKFTILSYGYFAGRQFVIGNSRGKFPIAYVEAKAGDPNLYPDPCSECNETPCDVDYMELTSISEITFGPKEIFQFKDDQKNIPFDILSKKYWGWDHGEYGDHVVLTTPFGLDIGEGKKYTEEEILTKDVIPFICWINWVNKKNS